MFHAAELAVREASILAFSLHPGLVDTPLSRSLNPETLAKFCSRERPGKPCPLSAAEGAATSTFLASAQDIEVRRRNGAFNYVCEPVPSVRTLYETLHGEEATAQYQANLYDMILGWARS